MRSTGRYWLSVLILILWACKKDKVPAVAVPPEPTKWEKVAGHYKVYDTLGVYLYEMDLVHIHNSATNRDSIRWEQFDGEFSFTTEQQEFSNIPMILTIGGGMPYMIPTINVGSCLRIILIHITIIGVMIRFHCVFKKQTSIIILRM